MGKLFSVSAWRAIQGKSRAVLREEAAARALGLSVGQYKNPHAKLRAQLNTERCSQICIWRVGTAPTGHKLWRVIASDSSGVQTDITRTLMSLAAWSFGWASTKRIYWAVIGTIPDTDIVQRLTAMVARYSNAEIIHKRGKDQVVKGERFVPTVVAPEENTP